MTLAEEVTKNIIRKLIKGQDYRIEVVQIINAEFLQFAIDFFKQIIDAKLRNDSITSDWYKKIFLNHNLTSAEIAINSGLNKKTIHNMFNSSTKEIVINAAEEHWTCSTTRLVVSQVSQNARHFAVFKRKLFRNFSF